MSKEVYEILEIFDALKRHKNTIYLVSTIFLATFLLSYVFIYYDMFQFRYFGNLMYETFKIKVQSFSIDDKGPIEIFTIILANNLFVAAFTYIIMFFALINIAVNSYLLAYVLYLTEPLKFILLIGPHGIFEIPALILAATSGLILSMSVIKKFRKEKHYIDYFKDSLRIFLISVILFVIAALIEVFITYQIALWIA
ncbi:stage II sporulation protein M [Methanococcus sp. CF]